MALLDTLESLVASVNENNMSIFYAASVLKCECIRSFLDLCDHYGLELKNRAFINDNINVVEREYSSSQIPQKPQCVLKQKD